MILASIDLGTNTFRILVASIQNNIPEFIYRKSVITGLGIDFDKKNRLLSVKSIDRGLGVLKEFASIVSTYNVVKVNAVATSIVRESFNKNKFLIQAQDIINYPINVISGVREAELTVIGVLNNADYKGNKIIVDIGGGSTEIAIVDKYNNTIGLHSAQIGVVRISQQFDFTKQISLDMKNEVSQYIKQEMLGFIKDIHINFDSNFEFIITAGTPTTLAAINLRLKEYDRDLVNNHVLNIHDINDILHLLLKLSSIKRLKIIGMINGRENLIIPGTLIILNLLELYNKSKIIVSDNGLLEGIIYSELLNK